jgi:hypothetical protein
MSFTSAQLLRYSNEAEMEVSKLKWIIDRIALTVSSGVSQYQLPSYAMDVRKITYKGNTLTPYSGREMINSTSSPVNVSTGVPKTYVFSYFGQGVIQLFPTPNTNVSAPATSLWEETAITNGVIVEFFRTPHSSDESLRIHEEIRDAFFEDYIYGRAYEVEGKEQDLTAARFHRKLWENALSEIQTIPTKINKCVVKEMRSHIFNSQTLNPRPHLPPQFGKVVS